MLELIRTADGSNTIYNSEVGENYHSRNGALQESRHVFVNSGLCYFLEKTRSFLKVPPTGGDPIAIGLERVWATVSILEVGFGTGLNFLLSADLCAEKKVRLNYTGIEAYPLSKELATQTGYDQYVSASTWQRFTDGYEKALSSQIQLNPNCRLQIASCKLLDFESANQYDIIYYDAFAAARQPEMWDEAAIAHTIRFLKPGGVFVTYAITGNLKRSLKALGCTIEKAPGAAGKREMLRAVKLL
ncbi:MAG TPA: tRNA (5-methylaminomethyl-2-thiouridine)(34)-methyltransferase MnmD [Mucilaginibacter sp.]|jgi:tRNA U34 5-methylaminomethyl-2-thiouridine-forming methyltransferase MnmC|nr:tRNA (5-methylaminomethyl-2-thiouridine)(34)-methyltransferase MnmD [Mucilaginibacter sp.]